MHIRAAIACAALALAPHPSPAQTISWLRASAGVEQSAQRNPGESPYVYSGFGGTLTLGCARDTRTASFDITGSGSLGSLTSSLTTGTADHRTGELSFRALHALTGHFAGAIYVLVNRDCASATEAFHFAMRAQPGVTFVGDTTADAMGNPMIRDLPNGWEYRMPRWLEYDASTRLLEGTGIVPDLYIPSTAADSAAGKDAQLEAALALAAQPKPQ